MVLNGVPIRVLSVLLCILWIGGMPTRLSGQDVGNTLGEGKVRKVVVIPEPAPENPRERIGWVIKWIAKNRMTPNGLRELDLYLQAGMKDSKEKYVKHKRSENVDKAWLDYYKRRYSWYEEQDKIVKSMIAHHSRIGEFQGMQNKRFQQYIDKLKASLKEKALEFTKLRRQPPRPPRRSP